MSISEATNRSLSHLIQARDVDRLSNFSAYFSILFTGYCNSEAATEHNPHDLGVLGSNLKRCLAFLSSLFLLLLFFISTVLLIRSITQVHLYRGAQEPRGLNSFVQARNRCKCAKNCFSYETRARLVRGLRRVF